MSQPKDNSVLPSLEQLASAPRYGLNARELILQAAAKVEAVPQQREAQPLKPGQAASSRPVQRLNPAGLVASIHHANRPIVPFVARSSIPRLQRQGCCDALLGQYYVILLEACKLGFAGNQAKAIEALKSADALRAAAGAAASAHEQAVFMSAMSKQEYTTAAAKATATRQSLVQHAGVALDAVFQQYHLTKEAFLRPASSQATASKSSAAAGHDGNVAMQQSQPAQDNQDEDLFGEHDSDDDQDAEADAGKQTAAHANAAKGSGEKAVTTAGNNAAATKVLIPPLQPDSQHATSVTLEPQDANQSVDAQASNSHKFDVDEEWDVDDGGREYCPGREDVQGKQNQDLSGQTACPRTEEPNTGKKSNGHDPLHSHKRKPGDAENSGTATRTKQSSVSTSSAKRVKLGPHSNDSLGNSNQQSQQKHASGSDSQANSSEQSRTKGTAVSPGKDAQKERSRSPSSVSPAPVTAGNAAAGVADQVGEFVKGVLDPLYRAQLLDKQQYKEIVRKAVSKVMAHHKDATSAGFLLKEHEQVRRYVMKLVDITASTQA